MLDVATLDPTAGEVSPDLDSAMDDFFSAPPAPGGDAAGAPPAPDGDPPLEAAAPAPDFDAALRPDEPAPPAAAPPNPNLDLPEGATLEADGKHIRIPVNRWNNVYGDQGYKYAQQVRQFAPTAQDARSHFERANDLRHMHTDFASGDPAQIDEFLNYWEAQSPDGFGVMANRMLERAPAAAREQFSTQTLSSKADELYQRAAESGDPDDLYKARMFEWSHAGKYRSDPLQKPDPLAARERDLTQRETRLQQDEQQRAERTWKSWESGTYSSISTTLNGKIDQLLSPVADRFRDAAELFNALKSQIRSEVIKGVEGDQEWLRNFNLDFRGARRSMSPGDRSALTGTYIAKADQILTTTASKLVSQASRKLVTQNGQEHARLDAGSRRSGTAQAGAPVRQSIAPTAQRRQEMSLEEKIDADMG